MDYFKWGSLLIYPIVGSIVPSLIPALEVRGHSPGPYPIKFDSHISQGGWARWITWTSETPNKSGLTSVRLGALFNQLFASFRGNPCEFCHTKTRPSTSNSRGLKGFSGTTNHSGSRQFPKPDLHWQGSLPDGLGVGPPNWRRRTTSPKKNHSPIKNPSRSQLNPYPFQTNQNSKKSQKYSQLPRHPPILSKTSGFHSICTCNIPDAFR